MLYFLCIFLINCTVLQSKFLRQMYFCLYNTDSRLMFIFTKINPADPTQRYTFLLRVNQDEKYEGIKGGGTLTRAVWYFKEGGMVLWRGWYGTLKRVVWYFEDGGVVLWRGWCVNLKHMTILTLKMAWVLKEGGWYFKDCVTRCVTLKRLVWHFEESCVVYWRWCFEDGGEVLQRGWCGSLKRDGSLRRELGYLKEGDVLLWWGWCGTLKRVACYFERGGVILGTLEGCVLVVLWRELCGTLKWKMWCGTLKRVLWYFEEIWWYTLKIILLAYFVYHFSNMNFAHISGGARDF